MTKVDSVKTGCVSIKRTLAVLVAAFMLMMVFAPTASQAAPIESPGDVVLAEPTEPVEPTDSLNVTDTSELIPCQEPVVLPKERGAPKLPASAIYALNSADKDKIDALSPALMSGTPPVLPSVPSHPPTTLATYHLENFNGAFPPAGWTVVDSDAYGGWYQDNMDAFGNPSPDTTQAAYVEFEMGYAADEYLISPVFDLSLYHDLTLDYDYIWQSNDVAWSEGYVLGSTDGGATWPYNIYTFPNDAAWATGTHSWDISAWADGQSNVAFCFLYQSSSDDWFWMIDNFLISYDAGIFVTPPGFDFAVYENDVDSDTMTIGNDGAVNVDFVINPGTEETYGSFANTWTGNLRDRGNIYFVNADTVLSEIQFYMDIPVTMQMYFFVYSGTATLGSYSQIFTVHIPDSGTGAGWYSSGLISVNLVSGNYYYIGTAWEGTATYGRSNDAVPIPTSFGFLETGIPGPLTGWPMVDPINNGYTGYSPYAQILRTGFTPLPPWLSVTPMSGTVIPFDHTDCTVGVDSTGLIPGLYTADIIVSSTDLLNPMKTIPVTLTVLPPPYQIDIIPVAQEEYGSPGEVVDYMLTVTNTGTAIDTFDLDVSGNVWPTELYNYAAVGGAEDFSGSVPPAGWAESGISTIPSFGVCPTWWGQYDDALVGFPLVHSPTYCAGVWWSDSWLPQDEWLTTPTMDWSAVPSATLDFWSVYYWAAAGGDFYNTVEVSTDGGTTWTVVADLINDPTYWLGGAGFGGAGWNWNEVPITLDLTAFAGEPSVMLAWHYVWGTGGNAGIWMIDDATLTAMGAADITDEIGPLNPGESANFLAKVTIPIDAAPGDFDVAQIEATSQHDPSISDTATVTTHTVPAIPWFDDMEDGPDGWTPTGYWHWVDDSSPYPNWWSPTASWWYGQDATGDYDDGFTNWGRLESPVLDLRDVANPVFSFREWVSLEYDEPENYDLRYVQVNNGGGWTDLANIPNDIAEYDQWIYRQFDLSAYSGQIIQVGFLFDTVDDVLNDYPGWYIDDAYVGPEPYAVELVPDMDIRFENTGTWTSFYMTVFNEGFFPDTYDIFGIPQWQGWDVEIWAEDWSGTIDTLGPIQPGESMSFWVMVFIPAGLAPDIWEYVQVTAQSQAYPIIIDVSDLYICTDPLYYFEIVPDTQTNFGWVGEWVEHRVQITNLGNLPDVYQPMFYVGVDETVDADWWTKFFTVDLRPQGIYNGIDDGSETWWWGPVMPGETKEYAIKVFVPTDDIGAFDQARIYITSDNNDAVVKEIEIWTRLSMPAPFYDEFELAGTSGEFGLYNDPILGQIHGAWTRTNDNVDVSAQTSYTGTYSMYTSGGAVSATTCKINMEMPYGMASCVIRRGDDGFSEDPDNGEDLIVEYSDGNFQWAEWHELATFPGSGTPGEVFTPLWILPEDALNPRFQLRFRQTGGGNDGGDYWHIDNVYIGAPDSDFELQQFNSALAILFDDFEDGDFSDWTSVGTSDDWEIGTPTGLGGDPIGAYSGTYSIGNDLFGNGRYENNVPTDQNYIYSPAIDCTDFTGVTLEFYRWLGIENVIWDHAYIYVSNDGVTWNQVWSHNSGSFTDTAWTYMSYDISAWADDQPTVYVRFDMGPTDSSVTYCGWNIDDVRISGNPPVTGANEYSAPGETKVYGVSIQNYARHCDEYAISIQGNEWPTWVLPDMVGPLGPNGPQNTGMFLVYVDVPADAMGLSDTVTVTVTSILDPWVSETIILTTSVGRVHNLDQDTWYMDIQPAIDAANPGEHIHALPGLYEEDIVVDIPLTITGEDRETTIIDGTELTSLTGWLPNNINSATVPNILLLHADDGNGEPLRTQLLALGGLGVVDAFDARGATPSLAQLQVYDIVITWSNYLYADRAGIGNVLADYVDAGGKVIDMEFAIDPNWGMQGRFMTEQYTAMSCGPCIYTVANLGTYDPTHPIMQGVTAVSDGYRAGGTALTPGSTEVARWDDGELFIAAKDDGTVITINTYPGFYLWWTGQMDQVIHNSVSLLMSSIAADSVVRINADTVSFSGFTVQNGPVGIILDSVTGCDIGNNIIRTCGGGISVQDSSVNYIHDNEISDNAGGSFLPNSIETTFAGGNSYAGNMFDVEVKTELTITSIDVHVDSPGTTVAFELYYRVGTYVGFDTNPDDWTLAGSGTSTSMGFGTPTSINIPDFTLPADTYGFFVYQSTYPAANTQYTNGNNVYENDEMIITTGIAKGDPGFTGATFTPRTWNGRIHYTIGNTGPGIHVAGTHSFLDDFSADSGLWTYTPVATMTAGYCRLTQNVNGQVGSILFNHQINSPFVAEFDYLAGGGTGADGMAMNFFKEAYTPAGGGLLGMVDNADFTSLGYSVEFDNYNNGGTDPSANHIAIIQDQYLNHLASVNDPRTEDNIWHHAKVIVTGTNIAVYVDDMVTPVLTWAGSIDMTYGGFSFSAGTGGLNNNHFVDNIYIETGNVIENNQVHDNDVGFLLWDTTYNRIFHNNIMSNGIHAIDNGDTNQWDGGYPTGGNYWSGFTGPDTKNGPLQNLPGADGMIDNPYVIDPDSQDKYPLRAQYTMTGIVIVADIVMGDPVEEPVADAGGGRITMVPPIETQSSPAVVEPEEIPVAAEDETVTETAIAEETVASEPVLDIQDDPVLETAVATPSGSGNTYLLVLLAISIIVLGAALFFRKRK